MHKQYYLWRAVVKISLHKRQIVTLYKPVTAETFTVNQPDSTYYAGHYSLIADREDNLFVHEVMPRGHPGKLAVSINADFVEKSLAVTCGTPALQGRPLMRSQNFNFHRWRD